MWTSGHLLSEAKPRLATASSKAKADRALLLPSPWCHWELQNLLPSRVSPGDTRSSTKTIALECPWESIVDTLGDSRMACCQAPVLCQTSEYVVRITRWRILGVHSHICEPWVLSLWARVSCFCFVFNYIILLVFLFLCF